MKGWKTWVGVVGYAACDVAKVALPQWADMIMLVQGSFFAPLAAIGVAHKIEKASGWGRL